MKKASLVIFIVCMASIASYWTQCQSAAMTSAKVYLQQSNFEKAEEQALAAVETEPANPEPSFWLASNIYAKKKRWQDMVNMFEKSLSISNKFATEIDIFREKFWVEKYNIGAQNLNSVISKEAADPDAALEKAIPAFLDAILIKPSKPQAYSSVSTAYLQIGDLENAKTYMLKTIELDPEDVATLVNLGIMLSKEEKYDEANVHLQRVLEIEPGNVNAIQQFAQNLDLAGKEEEAEAAYMEAIKTNPDNPNLYYNLGVLYIKRKDYARAEERFLKSLELNPDDCDAISNVAVVFSNMEDKLEEAEKYLLKAAECDPVDHTYWRSLVAVYMKLGKPDKAKEALDKAKELGYSP